MNERTLRIGIFGSATTWSPDAEVQAERLGTAVARAGAIAVTGATSGLPHIAAVAALRVGATVLGVSPAKNPDEHASVYRRPLDGCSHIFYTGNGFTGRNYLNVRNCDGAIVIGGEWGTLEELCICTYEGKVAGILERSGGICSVVREIERSCSTLQAGQILYGDDPAELLERVLSELRRDRPGIPPAAHAIGRSPHKRRAALPPRD